MHDFHLINTARHNASDIESNKTQFLQWQSSSFVLYSPCVWLSTSNVSSSINVQLVIVVERRCPNLNSAAHPILRFTKNSSSKCVKLVRLAWLDQQNVHLVKLAHMHLIQVHQDAMFVRKSTCVHGWIRTLYHVQWEVTMMLHARHAVALVHLASLPCSKACRNALTVLRVTSVRRARNYLVKKKVSSRVVMHENDDDGIKLSERQRSLVYMNTLNNEFSLQWLRVKH